MAIPLGDSTISVDFSFYEQHAPGTLKVKRLNGKERAVRSAKRAVIVLACTAVALLIPPHIVWLLLGLIVGPVLTYFTFRQEYLLIEGRGSCPVCKTEISLESGAIHWPIRENCRSCHRELEILEERAQPF
jgi:hypothetical protein